MKKKIVIFALVFCLMLPCVGLLSACGGKTEQKEQQNPLSINSVYQNSNGDVMLDLNLANYTVNTLPGSRLLEVTADGGITWKDLSTMSFALTGKETISTFVALKYYTSEDGSENESGWYYMSDSSGDYVIDFSKRVAESAQETINLAIRFAETEEYKASAASNSVSYTLKEKSEALNFYAETAPAQEFNIIDESTKDEYLGKLALSVEKENGNLTLVKFNCEQDGSQWKCISTTEFGDDDPDLEYKFLDFNEYYRNDIHNPSEVKDYYENIASGWSNLNKNTTITSDLYSEYQGTENSNTVVFVLIRQKESSTTTVSSAVVVKLSFTITNSGE